MIVFNKEQTEFLKKEFGLEFEPNVEAPLTREEWVKLKDDCFEIEVDETIAADDEPLSERGDIAVSICDKRWNK